MAHNSSIVGAKGERLAVEWLRQNGYMIVALNWRDGRYELDIVAQKGFTLHIIEVKTRSVNGWCTPEDAMNPNKIRALIHASSCYLGANPTQLEVQIDLVAVDIEQNGESHVRYIPEVVQGRW